MRTPSLVPRALRQKAWVRAAGPLSLPVSRWPNDSSLQALVSTFAKWG